MHQPSTPTAAEDAHREKAAEQEQRPDTQRDHHGANTNAGGSRSYMLGIDGKPTLVTMRSACSSLKPCSIRAS